MTSSYQTTVRIVRDFEYPKNLFRQTPGENGVWGNVRFTEDALPGPDFLVILNRSPMGIQTTTPIERTWALRMEPPVREYRFHRRMLPYCGKVFTPDTESEGNNLILSHGALPWHLDQNFDMLDRLRMLPKPRMLSWITSDKKGRGGHKQRMEFLHAIRGKLDFDLYGRGFQLVADKFEAHRDYRFSIVVENCRAPHYWTEKLTDCLLSWTFPFYCGCPNLADYFPADSFQFIDIDHPEKAIRTIQEFCQRGLEERHYQAMAEARRRILHEHQLFPFIANVIEQSKVETIRNVPAQPKHMRRIPKIVAPWEQPWATRNVQRRYRGWMRKLGRAPSKLRRLMTGDKR